MGPTAVDKQWTEDTNLGTSSFLPEIFGQKTPTFVPLLSFLKYSPISWELYQKLSAAIAEQNTIPISIRITAVIINSPHCFHLEKRILKPQATSRSQVDHECADTTLSMENSISITYCTKSCMCKYNPRLEADPWQYGSFKHTPLTLQSISLPQFFTNACQCYPTTILFKWPEHLVLVTLFRTLHLMAFVWSQMDSLDRGTFGNILDQYIS